MKFHWPQMLAIAVALGLSVLIFLAPTQSPETAELKDLDSLDLVIREAVAIVNDTTKPPMKGILMLRDAAEADPTRVEAQYQLGLFSMQSRQYEKAVGRFERVIELAPDRVDAHYYLGNAHASLGNKTSAIESLERYKTFLKDNEELAEIDKLINELKNN